MESKIYQFLNTFADLESLVFEVPTICLVTACVSLRRDRRYVVVHQLLYLAEVVVLG